MNSFKIRDSRRSTQIIPVHTINQDTVWAPDPLFERYLWPILKDCGRKEQELVILSSSISKDLVYGTDRRRCNYIGQDGIRCKTVNSGHHSRHMVSHLPDGLGFFVLCPVCKAVSRRADMNERHLKSCGLYTKDNYPAFYKDAYHQNYFLR